MRREWSVQETPGDWSFQRWIALLSCSSIVSGISSFSESRLVLFYWSPLTEWLARPARHSVLTIQYDQKSRWIESDMAAYSRKKYANCEFPTFSSIERPRQFLIGSSNEVRTVFLSLIVVLAGAALSLTVIIACGATAAWSASACIYRAELLSTVGGGELFFQKEKSILIAFF